MRQRYSLTALRAFEAAARTGSFAAAAEELFVTRPAISKQIRLLEENLGCTLFGRAHGSVTLTELGADLYAGVTQSFDLISETMDRVRSRGVSGDSLRILVEHDFASSWLAGTIGRFLVDHPGISIDIVAKRNGVLRMDEDFNFRIFYADPSVADTDTPLERRELCRWIDLPLCAPDYIDTNLAPETVLSRAHLLHDRNAQPWSDWLRAAGVEYDVDPNNGTVFNETSLGLSAAIAHAGIVIGDSFLALQHIRDGMLVPPFPLGLRSRDAYMLCRRLGREHSPAERAFEDWIQQALSSYMAEVEGLLAWMNVRIAK